MRNTDSLTAGELLLDFFEFYAFTFESDKYAIDIRYPTVDAVTGKMTSPYRYRTEFLAEARVEFQA